MMHLRKASVLISGIGSVGVEVAKNLILGGIRRVTIHDTRDAKWLDLSAQVRLYIYDIHTVLRIRANANGSLSSYLKIEEIRKREIRIITN